MASEEGPLKNVQILSRFKERYHMVIGSEQIRGCEDVKLENQRFNFPIQWSVVNRSPKGIMQNVKNAMETSPEPLALTVMPFVQDIENLKFEDVTMILDVAQNLLDTHEQHKMAIPELMFPPGLEAHYKLIDQLNVFIAEFNERQGFKRYPMWNVGTRARPGGKIKTKRHQWSEDGLIFLDRFPVARFIRWFHEEHFITLRMVVENDLPPVLPPPVPAKSAPSEAQPEVPNMSYKAWLAMGEKFGFVSKLKAKWTKDHILSCGLEEDDVRDMGPGDPVLELLHSSEGPAAVSSALSAYGNSSSSRESSSSSSSASKVSSEKSSPSSGSTSTSSSVVSSSSATSSSGSSVEVPPSSTSTAPEAMEEEDFGGLCDELENILDKD